MTEKFKILGKFIKDFKDKIISNIKFLSPNGNKIDDRYGVLTPNFNFVWTHDDVEKSVNKRDARFIYIIDYKRGGTQRRLMIPDWFFTAKFDIDRIVLKLDIAFNTMSNSIREFAKDY